MVCLDIIIILCQIIQIAMTDIRGSTYYVRDRTEQESALPEGDRTYWITKHHHAEANNERFAEYHLLPVLEKCVLVILCHQNDITINKCLFCSFKTKENEYSHIKNGEIWKAHCDLFLDTTITVHQLGLYFDKTLENWSQSILEK